MPEMTDVHGLSVATTLKTFIDSEALPGTGLEPDAFWKNFSDLLNGLAPKNRELLQIRADMQRAVDEWHVARRGKPQDMAEYRAFLDEIGYLVPEGPDFCHRDRQCRSGDRASRRAAARRAGDECPLCAQRRQCALGLALRRALRHRRHGRPARRARATTARAARASSPGPRASSTSVAPLEGSARIDVTRYAVDGRRAGRSNSARARRRPEGPAAVRRLSRRRVRPTAVLSQAQRPACRDRRSTAEHLIGKNDPAGSRRRRAGSGDHDDHGLRGFGRGGRRRGQGARLPQLARPDEGRPRGAASRRAARPSPAR